MMIATMTMTMTMTMIMTMNMNMTMTTITVMRKTTRAPILKLMRIKVMMMVA